MKKWMMFLALVILASCANPKVEDEGTKEQIESTQDRAAKMNMTQAEKEKGYRIFPEMGVKYFMDSEIWKKNGGYLYAHLDGDTKDEGNPIYSSIYYRYFTPTMNEQLNEIYTDKNLSKEDMKEKEKEILREMKPLFGIVVLRAGATEGVDVAKLTGYDQAEEVFRSEDLVTYWLSGDENKGTLSGEDLKIYETLWQDIAKARESLVVVKPLTLAESLSSFDLLSMKGMDLHRNEEISFANIFKEHKLTMVNVWATYCPPCRAEMPDVLALAEEMKDQGLALVGFVGDTRVGSMENVKEAKELVGENAKDNVFHFLRGEDINRIIERVPGYPTTFFVDREGHVVGESFVGGQSKETFKKAIEEALK